MKGFFELLGFAATALFAGFLAFLYIGHSKNSSPKTERVSARIAAENGIETEPEGSAYVPADRPRRERAEAGIAVENTDAAGETQSPRRRTAKNFPGENPRPAPVARTPKTIETAAETADLTDLYEDETFVEATVSKWRRRVSAAADDSGLRPGFLMANVLIRSYTGDYTEKAFAKDVEKHAGDTRLPSEKALAAYPAGRMVSNLSRMYGLDEVFAAATVPALKITAAKPKASPKSPAAEKRKNLASKKPRGISEPKNPEPRPTKTAAPLASETAFREMVAKEEGFTSWKTLAKLADADTQRKAEKRVRVLMSSTRIR